MSIALVQINDRLERIERILAYHFTDPETGTSVSAGLEAARLAAEEMKKRRDEDLKKQRELEESETPQEAQLREFMEG